MLFIPTEILLFFEDFEDFLNKFFVIAPAVIVTLGE